MGFIKGKVVEVLLNAPLKDPIKYKILGYEISLRRSEAEMIEIISEQEAEEQTGASPHFHGSINEERLLTEDELKNLALRKRRTINVALVGNPNCGKTSLFNLASGAHEHETLKYRGTVSTSAFKVFPFNLTTTFLGASRLYFNLYNSPT